MIKFASMSNRFRHFASGVLILSIPFACTVGEAPIDAVDGMSGRGNVANKGGRGGQIRFSAPVVVAPSDTAGDGSAHICINKTWWDSCDVVVAGDVGAIRVPVAGSITVESASQRFDTAVIAERRTGGASAGTGGQLWLSLSSVGPGCDVQTDGFTLLGDISKLWDTVTVSPDGKTLSWDMSGENAALFDDADCHQIRSPANLGVSMRLPLVDKNGSTSNELLSLSTIPGDGHLLPPIVLTNADQPSGDLDLVFVIDTTGSMFDDLAAVKSSAIELVQIVFANSPNSRIAVIDYKDFPISPYGSSSDFPYRVAVEFSSDPSHVVQAINELQASGGADWPESVYSGLMAALEPHPDHTGKTIGAFRSGAQKSILLFGDAPPHDPEPITGYTLQIVRDAAVNGGSPVPPMPNAKALSALGADGGPVSIYTLQIGGDSVATSYFNALSAGTGGQSFTATNASGVVEAMREALGVITPDPVPANRAPVTRWAAASIARLSPPNHQMVDVDILGVVDPDGDPVIIEIVAITQNEPVSGPEKVSPDGTGLGTSRASLRAERSGNASGRVYRVTFNASDPHGGVSTGSILVCVPHDQGENSACHDDGQVYDSTAP